jgi:cysteine desulfuration protein SufE
LTDVDEILDTFELLGDWDQRYQYLVELGDAMPPLDDAERTEANRVKPCMSQVWVSVRRDPSDPTRLRLAGDCDTAIIKGVVALLVSLADGRTAREVLEIDFDGLFEGMHLAEHLSPSRHVGIYAIVETLKQQAGRHLDAAA